MGARRSTARTRRQPQRTCVACRSTEAKRGLVRLVRDADGRVHVDERGREPGRGAYLHADAACWERALAGAKRGGGALAHALRTNIDEADRAALREYARRFESNHAGQGAATAATAGTDSQQGESGAA